MSISKKSVTMGAALAFAAASLTAVPTIVSASESAEAKVHCFGVNKCKGHNDCKTATNACKGMASCKGQGFVGMSASACDGMGGTVK